jgi:hypothetical protein
MSIKEVIRGWRDGLPLPYPPDSREGLAARWVRWAAGFGQVRHPIADRTGAYAGLHQPGDVWFLAGTFGGTVERRCAVPAGRPVFLPAFNIWRSGAAGPIGHMHGAFGELLVDGVNVELDVISTPIPFKVAGALGNPVTGLAVPTTAVVWGLWRSLVLPPGQHTLILRGGDGHGFTVGATYHVMVS